MQAALLFNIVLSLIGRSMLFQSGVFFLSRHPLKIIWSVVALAIALLLENPNQIKTLDAGSAFHQGEHPEHLYHVQTYLISSDLDENSVFEDIAMQNDQVNIFASNYQRLGGKVQMLRRAFLARYLVLVSPNNRPVVTCTRFLVQGLELNSAFDKVFKLMQRGKWMEISFLLAGMSGVLYSIIVLFKKFRQLGSKFSLACCTLLVTAMDLLFGLAILNRLGLSVDPLFLVEFGPLFLMAVGFRKAYVLARNIYRHRKHKGDLMSMVVGVEESMRFLRWSYGQELTLFSLFAFSGVAGLREFSLLCVLVLLVDVILLHTFFLGTIAYRLRLHAFREEAQYNSASAIEESPWKSRTKLLATVIVLGLYAMNVLSSLSVQAQGPMLDLKLLESVLLATLPPLSRITFEPTLRLCKDSREMIGISSILQEIMRQTIFDDQRENLDWTRLVKVCVFVSLPLSLLINYYLLRLVNGASRTLHGPAPLQGSPVAEPARRREIPVDDQLVIEGIKQGKIPLYALEQYLDGDCVRAVKIRREYVMEQLQSLKRGHQFSLDRLPWDNYDFSPVMGRNCENVIGYMALPVGVAGPILVDEEEYFIPMATTEGALVASTSRGCKALSYAGGSRTAITGDGMTRGPVVAMTNLAEAMRLSLWIEGHFESLCQVFNDTSRYLSLEKVDCKLVGRLVYMRFKACTGDAMGMNMVSRATDNALHYLQHEFPSMRLISLSGNFCSDKKATTINWIDGRGKSVVVEASIPQAVLTTVLKTTATAMVEANTAKNLVGSMVAGTIGGSGCNAHAANIIAALFISLGQDPAQVVASSSCLTFMEAINDGADLYVSCTMPSIECGTVGGGTGLAPQRACLEMLIAPSTTPRTPGEDAARLARILASVVMAGEVSLLASLTEGTLVKAHQCLNAPSNSR